MQNLIAKKIAPILGVDFNTSYSLVIQTPNFKFGDYTIVALQKKEFKDRAKELSSKIKKELESENLIDSVQIAGLFINVFINPINYLNSNFKIEREDKNIMLEYPSPNTNKPLHIGHLRNISLGDSLYRLFSEKYNVSKMNLLNDRGITICKTMVGYSISDRKESLDTKSDHFVGDLYVLYGQEAKKNPSLENEAKRLLQLWEAEDKDTIDLWKKIIEWFEAGMEETFNRLQTIGVDVTVRESNIYKRGKDIVLDGYKKGLVQKDEVGNYIIDLEEFNLPTKVPYVLALREDMTSVYLTQDLYLIKHKIDDYNSDRIIYIVGSEQELYFRQLFASAKKVLDIDAELEHYSFGMVVSPKGRFKSREGTTADIDNLLNITKESARDIIKSKSKDLDDRELDRRAEVIALSALKYFILSYDRKKEIVFDIEKSLSLDNNSGPYILYTYARINSLIEKMGGITNAKLERLVSDEEIEVARKMAQLNSKIELAIRKESPHILANYINDLSNSFNSLYSKVTFIDNNKESVAQRYALLVKLKEIYKKTFYLLNIPYLKRM